MLAQQTPGVVINTGSKQGITAPPGNIAYNVSKGGVKMVTEGLAYEFRNTENCQLSAHLLVPGFTYTGLIRRHIPTKPDAAWWPDQVADELIRRVNAGDFYIICPDNDVTPQQDNLRMQWAMGDVIHNRPALSRWHSDYEQEFAQFIEENLKG